MSLHLSCAHPLADVAAGHCLSHSAPLIGGVACGGCWEQAIRDDERFSVEGGLPRELAAEPELVDDVAVERAIHGQPVTLTRAERLAAMARLQAAGATADDIARLLHSSHATVVRELQLLEQHVGAA